MALFKPNGLRWPLVFFFVCFFGFLLKTNLLSAFGILFLTFS